MTDYAELVKRLENGLLPAGEQLAAMREAASALRAIEAQAARIAELAGSRALWKDAAEAERQDRFAAEAEAAKLRAELEAARQDEAEDEAALDDAHDAIVKLQAERDEAVEVVRDWVPAFDPTHSKACDCRICRARALLAKHNGDKP
jgi:hypothetical protein